MDIDEYQSQALKTRQRPSVEGSQQIVPFLGLAGETGELLNEYKKYFRDGSAHTRFRDRLSEELGDAVAALARASRAFDAEHMKLISDVAEGEEGSGMVTFYRF